MADGHGHDHGPVGDLSRIEAIRDQGVHRAGEHEGPFSLHVVGLGKTGANVISNLIDDPPAGFLEDPRTRFTALAVDIGDAELQAVRDAAGRLPLDRSQVRTVALAAPPKDDLFGDLRRYREFLKMEYPRYYWNPNYEPWLPSDIELPTPGEHFPRAVAKAIYGVDYYQGGEVWKELETFADSVDAGEATPIVCIVFGLGGGTGSGIVVDLARHLSSIKLGRRPWVVGIGVLPCEGDPESTFDGGLFPVINELDCMIDTEKNKGVMAVWGDLYKNPFTGGFFAVPQNAIYQTTKDLERTHDYVDRQIASFLAQDNGTHLYETLKLLNWLSVPADRWHPAIRGEPSDQWLNVLSLREPDDVSTLGQLEVAGRVSPGYAEARVFASKSSKKSATDQLEKDIRKQVAQSVETVIDPGVVQVASADRDGVSLFVPRLSKLDLEAFRPARDAYDQLSWDDKLLRHSWLLDLGVMLCEPSIRFDGMGGECIWGCACWVVVPHAAIRGEVDQPVTTS
jgi:Tubulin like